MTLSFLFALCLLLLGHKGSTSIIFSFFTLSISTEAETISSILQTILNSYTAICYQKKLLRYNLPASEKEERGSEDEQPDNRAGEASRTAHEGLRRGIEGNAGLGA